MARKYHLKSNHRTAGPLRTPLLTKRGPASFPACAPASLFSPFFFALLCAPLRPLCFCVILRLFFILSRPQRGDPQPPIKSVSAGVPVAEARRKGDTGCRSQEVAHVLGSRLSLGQANSARSRRHLRPGRPRPATPRRGPHRRSGHGCLSPRRP